MWNIAFYYVRAQCTRLNLLYMLQHAGMHMACERKMGMEKAETPTIQNDCFQTPCPFNVQQICSDSERTVFVLLCMCIVHAKVRCNLSIVYRKNIFVILHDRRWIISTFPIVGMAQLVTAETSFKCIESTTANTNDAKVQFLDKHFAVHLKSLSIFHQTDSHRNKWVFIFELRPFLRSDHYTNRQWIA